MEHEGQLAAGGIDVAAAVGAAVEARPKLKTLLALSAATAAVASA
jgi:hypothetical protein